MEQKYIYPVLLSTPYNIGKFIRVMTGYEYNHSGIALSPEIPYVYSFARRYKSAPFYGGFVRESILRYKVNGKIAKIKIFKIPVSEENYISVNRELRGYHRHSKSYIYNFASAAAVPFKRPVTIKGSYTCVEFVLEMLKKYTDLSVFGGKRFWSIKELDKALAPYLTYEGSAEPFISNGNWEGDSFREKISRRKAAVKTAGGFWQLGKRYVKK